MIKALVLGGGMVGSTIAAALAKNAGWSITVADRKEEALGRLAQRGLATAQRDLGDPNEVRSLCNDYDMVVGALSSVIGFQTLRAVLEAGKNYVDISFMDEDATALDGLAKKQGSVAVVDCGVAPGMSNMIAGYAAKLLEPCERISMYVGGLPTVRRWPYEYKAGFAPHDVIEEYTRPSRIVEHSEVVTRPALSEPELLDFPELGTLEAFNTDGLRSLVNTLKVPFMVEKTLRYPGHIELMRVLRDTGFFSKTPVQIGGQSVVPFELTAALLFPKWTFEPGESDITVMRIIAEGMHEGVASRLTWNLVDHHDRATDTRSMSRATAFPAATMARFIAEGRFSQVGVSPPEICGQQAGLLDGMLAALAKDGMRYDFQSEPLSDRKHR